jgi:hypothetical protein
MSLLPLKSEPSTKSVFNPSSEDFSVEYNDDNGIKTYTLPGLKMASFPTNVADHVRKHLADKLYQSRDNKVNYEVDIKSILEEIDGDKI